MHVEEIQAEPSLIQTMLAREELETKDYVPQILVALRKFRDKHGRTWKAQLRSLWNTGRDEGPLRMARNIIGPSGLDKIKFEE